MRHMTMLLMSGMLAGAYWPAVAMTNRPPPDFGRSNPTGDPTGDPAGDTTGNPT